jgi:site-specific DNA-methyltransferase (adenine-specific)
MELLNLAEKVIGAVQQLNVLLVFVNRFDMINFHNIDCIDFMKQKPENYYDLAIVDPPYGIGADKAQNNGGEKWGYKKYKNTDWDKEIPKKEYFEQLLRVSKNQIIWGGNYMTKYLFPSMGWIIWDKGQRNFSLADGEMAWTSFNKAMRIYGISRGKALAENNKEGNRIHPTQKPIQLYRWLLQNYATKGDKILDTHGGSGSIAIACNIEGFDLDICEIDKDYFEASKKRFNIHKSQLKLF